MAELSGKERSKYVRQMFTRLAGRYDKANRWMTWGQDINWRSEVIHRAQIPRGGWLLDLGTGTGDLALEARRRDATQFVVGADFTREMMKLGRDQPGGIFVRWLETDAHDLPFGSELFDAVVSGYLLRNVGDLQKTLSEQYRVLKAGGHMVCLDTTPPPTDLWHLPVRLYLRWIIPIIGGWVAGDKEGYRYLPESTRQFASAPVLAECLLQAGFGEVGYRRFMSGAMAIHWGLK